MQKNVVGLAAKSETAVAELNGLLIERNPTEGSASAFRFAPVQPRFAVALARAVLLLTDLLHGLGVQVETFLGGPGSQPRKVAVTQPFSSALNGFGLHLVAVIPDKIHRYRLRVEPRDMLVFDPISVGDLHRFCLIQKTSWRNFVVDMARLA
jgi:hypothetical protein